MDEERSTVHIIVSLPKPAREVGTCNACREQVDEYGTIPGAMVREVQLRTIASRLCERCARDLRWALSSYTAPRARMGIGRMGTHPTLPVDTVAIGLVRIDEKNNRFVYYEAVTFPNAPRATCDMYLRRAGICGKMGAGVESDYTVMALGPQGRHDVLDEWPIERKAARYLIEKLRMRVDRD